MLTTFKSAASADVIMFGAAAKALLETLGRDPEATQGIFTVEQLPAAIERLTHAIEQDKARRTPRRQGRGRRRRAAKRHGRAGQLRPTRLAAARNAATRPRRGQTRHLGRVSPHAARRPDPNPKRIKHAISITPYDLKLCTCPGDIETKVSYLSPIISAIRLEVKRELIATL